MSSTGSPWLQSFSRSRPSKDTSFHRFWRASVQTGSRVKAWVDSNCPSGNFASTEWSACSVVAADRPEIARRRNGADSFLLDWRRTGSGVEDRMWRDDFVRLEEGSGGAPGLRSYFCLHHTIFSDLQLFSEGWRCDSPMIFIKWRFTADLSRLTNVDKTLFTITWESK